MVWIINDGGSDKDANCAYVAAAALYSHATNQHTTSGNIVKQEWLAAVAENEDLAKFQKNFLSQQEPIKFNQSPNGIWNFEKFFSRILKSSKDDIKQGNDHEKKVHDLMLTMGKDGVDQYYRGNFLLKSGLLTYQQRDWDDLNRLEFELVDRVAQRAKAIINSSSVGGISKERNINAAEVVESLKDNSKQHKNCIFALHSYCLGHWLIGHAQHSNTDKETSYCKLQSNTEIRFFDYQPAKLAFYHLPFLGIKPSLGSSNTNEYDLVMISGAKPVEAGLPSEEFSGDPDRNFQEIAQQLNNKTTDKANDTLKYPNGAPLDAVTEPAL